ncbi:ankyrin repeats (3 copies) domain-containing protein [Trichoderma breve]|uniref:Ankyrin repeats (3 copies) domain-containing protein n=1 Tax=Trichoderma breve TaxID=2034170 RepID=A0A9W9EF03_9HYPO|nr:ankyrin repeats (3 copies) domain-containing protein [Trichoderma breve]KAJ4865496.1 ankyrin repeats (3 copies) domain-containing protein [Trichoderma breve]
MADDSSGKQLKAQSVDEDQPVDTDGLPAPASAKTWSDQSSDSGLIRHKPQLRTVWLQSDSSCIDFDVITVHGIRDDEKTAWRRGNRTPWIVDSLFHPRKIVQADYAYDIDEDAILYEPGGIEFYAEDLIWRFSRFRHPLRKPADRHPIIWICHDLGGTIVKEALRLALMNPRKYGDIAMLTTAIIFLGTPHRFRSIHHAEDQLHDLLLHPGPEIQIKLLDKIRNLATQVKRINDSFLDTKLLNHATIFNIVVDSLRYQRGSSDVSTPEGSEPYNRLNPTTAFSLHTQTAGHAFEAIGRHTIKVTGSVVGDGGPVWARVLADRLNRIGCNIEIGHEMLQIQARLLSLAPPTINPDTPFYATGPVPLVLDWIKEQTPYTNLDKAGTGFRFLHLYASEGSLVDIKYISRLLYLERDRDSPIPKRSTIYFEFDQWDTRYNNISSMLIYVMSTILSHFFKTPSKGLIFELNSMSEMQAWSLDDVYYVYRLLRIYSSGTRELTIFISCFDQCPRDQRRWFLERILEEQHYNESEYRLIFSTSTRGGLDVETFPDTAGINIDDCPSMISLKEEEAQDLLLGLERLLRSRPIYQSFRQSLKSVLEECESAPFLGHCILNWLQELPRGKPKSEIADIIHSLSPVTVENTVHVMISSLGSERKARAEKIFNWIKHAAEPWTLESLSEALVVDEFYDKEPYLSDINPRNLAAEMVKFLGGIITVKNRDVKFVHHSFYAIPELGIDGGNDDRAAQVNCSIAKVCLRYLQLQEAQEALHEFSSAVLSEDRDDEALIDTVVIYRPRTSLAEYAVQFWPRHYKACANIKPRHLVRELFANMKSRGHWETMFWLLSDPFIRPKRSYISEMPIYAMLGLEDLVNELLQTRTGQPFFQMDCWFAISEAARGGHSGIVGKLLQHVSVDDEELKNALCWAAGQGNPDTVRLLVEKVPNLKTFKWPELLFHRASCIGLNDLLTTILQSTCRDDKNGFDELYMPTAISNAVLWNCASSAEILLASDHKPDFSRNHSDRGDLLVMAAVCGTPLMVKMVLKAYGLYGDGSELTLGAIMHSRHEALKLIIKAGINFVSTEDDEAGKISLRPHLFTAAKRGATECVRTLLSYAVKPDILGTVHLALYQAVENRHTDIARLLLDYKPNQDLYRQFPNKPMFLSIAIETGDTELVSMMIQHGAEVNDFDPYYLYSKTPLSLACAEKQLEIVKLLVQSGADINYTGSAPKPPPSNPPLISALLYGGKEFAEYILQDQKVDVYKEAPDGITALIAATEYPSIVRQLLAKGLPISHINQDSLIFTALSRAVVLNEPESIKILINHDPKPDLEAVHGQYTGEEVLMGYTALQLACYWYYSECVRLLIDAGANVGFRNSKGEDALDILLGGNQGSKQAEECFRLLLFSRNSINAGYINEKRQTRLHFIQTGTRVSIVELLAAAGAPIDTQDEDGYTPLAIAVREENSSVARYLVKRGANVNIFGPKFGSILHLAVEIGDLSLVKFLVDAGADREAVDPKYGKSLLYTALDIRDDWKLRRMVKYLVDEAKVPINKFGGILGYPIISAAKSVGNPVTLIRIIKFLIRRKVEVNVADSQGRTALHFACVSASLERMKALVEAGANVDTKDKFGRLPIHFAAGTDLTVSTDPVTYLLDQYKDMDINVADQDGWTPLMWAARSGSADIITMLIERGADVWVRGRAIGAGGEWSALKLMNFSDNNTALRHLLEPKERVRVTSEGIEEEWDGNIHEIKPGDRKPYYCDSCFMDVVGRQWKCVDCSDDFALCFKCFNHRSDLHDLTHTFQVIEPLYREEDSKSDEDAASEAKNSDGEDFNLDGDY